jgi:hypothetical protein
MAKGRPPDDKDKRDVRAAHAQLVVESQSYPKVDDKVQAAAEEYRARGWKKMSKSTLYRLLRLTVKK